MRITFGAVIAILAMGCENPAPACVSSVPCVSNEQCISVAGTSCNTTLSRCQTVLCESAGGACAATEHCASGLRCRNLVCEAMTNPLDASSLPEDAGPADDAARVDPCGTDYSGTYQVTQSPLNDRNCPDESFGECTATRMAGGYRWRCEGLGVDCQMDADCTCRYLDDPYVAIDFPSGSYEVSPPFGLRCQGDF